MLTNLRVKNVSLHTLVDLLEKNPWKSGKPIKGNTNFQRLFFSGELTRLNAVPETKTGETGAYNFGEFNLDITVTEAQGVELKFDVMVTSSDETLAQKMAQELAAGIIVPLS